MIISFIITIFLFVLWARMKKKINFLLILWIVPFIFLLVIGVPYAINELYSLNSGYYTLWCASDVLSFYGDVLAFLGTVVLGVIAVWQTKKANDISEKMLNFETMKYTPFLHIDTNKSKFKSFGKHEIDLDLHFRNETESVINIIEVSDIKCGVFIFNDVQTLPFCKNWTKHYSVIPKQTTLMNFFIENSKIDLPFAEFFLHKDNLHLCSLKCEFSIKIHFANSKDIYTQNYEFFVNVIKDDNEKSIMCEFLNMENSVYKEEETEND